MQQTMTDSAIAFLARVPGEVVDQWLAGNLAGDEELYDVVRGGRRKDGSILAHPGFVAAIAELTGIEANAESVSIMSDEEIVLVMVARGFFSRVRNADIFENEDERSKILHAVQLELGKALTEQS